MRMVAIWGKLDALRVENDVLRQALEEATSTTRRKCWRRRMAKAAGVLIL